MKTFRTLISCLMFACTLTTFGVEGDVTNRATHAFGTTVACANDWPSVVESLAGRLNIRRITTVSPNRENHKFFTEAINTNICTVCTPLFVGLTPFFYGHNSDEVKLNKLEIILVGIMCLLLFCGIVMVVVLIRRVLRSDAKLQEMFDHAGDAMRVIDLDSNVIEVNKKYMELAGIDEFYPGKYKCMELISSECCHGETCPLVQIKSGKVECIEVEVDVTHRSEKKGVRYFILTATPYRNAKGKIVGVIEKFKDITERKEAKLISEKARIDAENLARIKSDFLANMSHEIRTPMNGVIGMTELLMETELTKEQHDLLEIISVCGENLLTIINDILSFSKIEAGKMLLEQHPFDLKKCVQEVFDLLSPKVCSDVIDFSYNFAANVPSCVVGDVTRLKQILVNLIGNSIKFTSKGKISLNVELVEQQREDGCQCECTLRFTVKDTGIGIPAEAIETLFDTFLQVDSSTTREFGGTGLGLAISNKLVTLMGGKIEVQSKVDEGSKFTFSVNVRCGDPLPQEVSHKQTSITEGVTGHGYKVLLVEDNLVNKKLYLKMLEKLGYNADSAENGVEALMRIETNRYDLIFMDLQMPQMDGLTCATHIINKYGRGLDNRPVIVAMTANAMPGDREKCLSAGMDDYLSKPVKKQDVLKMITHWREKMSTAIDTK